MGGRPEVGAAPRRGRELDASSFRRRLERSDVADELFFPAALGEWHEGRFRLPRGERGSVRTQISGVRFQAADPEGEDLAPEQACQRDVTRLVGGVRALREIEGLGGAVLSREMLRCRQPIRGAGTRIKFGLRSGARFEGDPEAARECHRRIVQGVRRSGLVVVHPRRFEPASGLAGLEAWASELRLRPRRNPWIWLLLLPLLLLLFLLPECSDEESFFGVPIETRSLIVLVDKSSSMEEHFAALRAEAKAVLGGMMSSDQEWYANAVAYDSQAQSALGGLSRVDQATSDRLMAFLDGLQAGGGTELRSGIEMAAAEVAAHGRPTTLVILTDARDQSIGPMLQDLKPVLERFQGVRLVGHALTPRLFAGGGDPAPRDEDERRLSALAAALGGRFGPQRELP